jgi:hypothetical protein
LPEIKPALELEVIDYNSALKALNN